MSTDTTETLPQDPIVTKGKERPVATRHRRDRRFVTFCVVTAFFSVVILVFLLGAIVYNGAPHISRGFLQGTPSADAAQAGIRPALFGTVWVCGICAVFALPIAVATAIFLEEFKPHHPLMRWFHSFVEINITNLAGVPSVVYGIIGLTAFVALFGMFGQNVNDAQVELGIHFSDQFGAADSRGEAVIEFPVEEKLNASVEIETGVRGLVNDEWTDITVIGPWDPLPEDATLHRSTIRHGSRAGRVEIDGQAFDEFRSFNGAVLRVPVDDLTAPVQRVERGMRVLNEAGDEVRVKVIDAEEIPKVTLREGTAAERVTEGNQHFDQFATSDNQILRVAVESATSPPTELVEDMILFTTAGQPVVVALSTSNRKSKYRSNFDLLLRAAPAGGRIERPAWYYFRLPIGRGVLAGSLTLMLVILPIVIIASQEALRAVPDSLREGAFAMGATPWQSVWNITLPAAIPGIMTGAILAISRAIGEAAPILVICGIVYITWAPRHMMDDFTVMPLQIYNWASRPQEEFHALAAAAILVLLVVLLSFNALAVFIRHKLQKPMT